MHITQHAVDLVKDQRAALVACGCAALLIACAVPARAGAFVDVGGQVTRMDADLANQPAHVVDTTTGVHLGIGVRRSFGPHSDLGVRLEFDRVGSYNLLSLRALDYRWNMSEHLAWTGFLGVSRLAAGTPAYGWYMGAGIQIKNIMPQWDLGIEARYSDHLARDTVLPSDSSGPEPDSFYSLTGLNVYLSYRF